MHGAKEGPLLSQLSRCSLVPPAALFHTIATKRIAFTYNYLVLIVFNTFQNAILHLQGWKLLIHLLISAYSFFEIFNLGLIPDAF